MPLRSIIQQFVERVDTLETKSKEGDDLYEKEFQELKSLTDEFRTSPQYCCSVGEQDINRRKNRYKDILPYDNNRVILSEIPGVPGSDYINASYIKGASGSQAYIASQAPLPHTVDDFWRMIWECEVQVIVMASREIEGGRPKCERYWPNEDETKQFGNITVKLVQQREMTADYNGKKLQATNGEVTRMIHHFHFHTWADHGVPLSVNAIIHMVTIMRSFQGTETLPVLVHCSAGCGRTGTVCAIDYVCGLLRTGKLSEDFTVKQLVLDMRRQRIAMVQTRDQYVLVHRALRELFSEHLKVIDSHPYENIDFSGRPKAFEVEHDYENLIPVTENENVSSQQQGASSGNKDSTSQNSCITDKQGQNNGSNSAENVIHNEKRFCGEKLPQAVDAAPPLPAKTKIRTARIEGESGDKGLSSSHEASPNTPHRSRDHSPIPPRKSKMEYVNDWCEGVTASKHGEMDTQSEGFRNSDSKIMSLSTTSITSNQSLSPSPTSKRSKTPEHNKRFAVDRPKISNLVRKPSMAKLRALFESNGNTDSSSPPSPESWTTDSSVSKLRRERTGSESSTGGHNVSKENETSSSPSIGRRKNRLRGKRILIDKGEYEALLSRYEDTAYRIFKESRRSENGELGSQLSIISHPSPSLLDNRENTLAADQNATVQLRRGGSASQSPSPAPLDTSTSTGESVAQQARELVGRLVGSRRNSFAEKRTSTWYDDEAAVASESAKPEPSSSLPNKVAHLFVGSQEKKAKSGEEKKPGNVVKRSFSMKVGFPSPLIRRKRSTAGNVAAYLAVEDNAKNKNHPVESQPIVVPVQNKVSRKPHGYVNVKPVQNPTFSKLTGDPVELTKYKIQDENGVVHKPAIEGATCSRTPSPFLSKSSPRASPVLRKSREASPIGSSERLAASDKARGHYGRILTPRQVAVGERNVKHLNGEREILERVHFAKPRWVAEKSNFDNVSGVQSERHIVDDKENPLLVFQKFSPRSDHRPRRKSAEPGMFRDDLFGADQDEYCQKMIRDCQEYLGSHQHSIQTPDAPGNLQWTEDPRRVILASKESLNAEPKSFNNKRTGANPDYERLWFSRSGQVAAVVASSRTKEDAGNTSVEEVTLNFPHQDDDDDEETRKEDDDDLLNRFYEEYNLTRDNKGYTKSRPLETDFPCTRPPKDVKVSNMVQELKHLIDELEVDLPSKPRKPQPAPRTIIPAPKSKASHAEIRHGKLLPHDYDYSVAATLDTCVQAEPTNPELTRRLKVEHVMPLQSSNQAKMGPNCSGNDGHEYEEVCFNDGKADRKKQHIYDNLRVDKNYSAHKIGTTSDEVARAAKSANLYGQVHKPRRKKQQVAESGTKVGEEENQWRQESIENDYETLALTSDWKDFDDNAARPVAPPRLRRNPSSSAIKPRQEVTVRRNSKDLTCNSNANSGRQEDVNLLPRYKWEAEFDDDDDLPPVPAKTKDAYLLPKGATGGNNHTNNMGTETPNSGFNNSGTSFTKALKQNFISKLVRKNEKDSDTSSIGSAGVCTPPLARKMYQKNQSELGFPHRLEKKPKGPRDPPSAWKVAT